MTRITIAGLDVAFSNDFMALVVVEYDYTKIRLVHLKTWRKFDWHLWKDDMRQKQSKFGFDRIYVDSTNNQSVAMELETMGLSTERVSFSNSSKRDMIQNATKLIRTRELVFPSLAGLQSPEQKKYFKELLVQLREQEYKHDSANPKLTHPPGRHDDLLWALCIALYGIKMNEKGEPLIMTFSLDDAPMDHNQEVLDRLLPGLGFGTKVTSVKIKLPGNDDYSNMSF